MYRILWKFQIKPENQSAFESAYGSNGDWVQLFKKSEGYLGTELMRQGEDFVTIDKWKTKDDYDKFRVQWKTDYEQLDKKFESVTESETKIDDFEA